MSPRTGRPKSNKPKTIEVKARIDAETNDRLNKYCKENGVTRTTVVRQGIEKVLDEKKWRKPHPEKVSNRHTPTAEAIVNIICDIASPVKRKFD